MKRVWTLIMIINFRFNSVLRWWVIPTKILTKFLVECLLTYDELEGTITIVACSPPPPQDPFTCFYTLR